MSTKKINELLDKAMVVIGNMKVLIARQFETNDMIEKLKSENDKTIVQNMNTTFKIIPESMEMWKKILDKNPETKSEWDRLLENAMKEQRAEKNCFECKYDWSNPYDYIDRCSKCNRFTGEVHGSDLFEKKLWIDEI